MLLDDAVADGEPQPGPLARHLRGEERVVDAAEDLRRDALAVVLHVQTYTQVLLRGANADLAPQGILGVEQQVEDHLLQLAAIALHR